MKRVNIFENTIKTNGIEAKHFGGEFLNNLFSQGLYVEAFLYYCLEVEDKIKYAIQCQELSVSKALKREGFVFKHSDKDTEKPLGALIVRLSLFCKDKKILTDLEQFNKLRKKVFHNLLCEDREKVNKEIESNLHSFYSLVWGLMIYGSDVLKRSLEVAVRKDSKSRQKNT